MKKTLILIFVMLVSVTAFNCSSESIETSVEREIATQKLVMEIVETMTPEAKKITLAQWEQAQTRSGGCSYISGGVLHTVWQRPNGEWIDTYLDMVRMKRINESIDEFEAGYRCGQNQ